MQTTVHNKRLSIPCFWITPKSIDECNCEVKKTAKFTSGRSSPHQAKLKKLKVPLTSSTRQNSPLGTKLVKKTTKAQVKPKIPSHKVKRKSTVKKTCKVSEKLCILQGEELKYAPKIFQNQIFSDVYDLQGRHDRIMEFELSMETPNTHSPYIVFESMEMPAKSSEGPKPPENSFLEETCQDSDNILSDKGKFDLFAKLELMAKAQT